MAYEAPWSGAEETLMTWKAAAVKIALFTPAPVVGDGLKIWSELVGASPTGMQPIPPAGVHLSGAFEDKQAMMLVQPGRFEVALLGAPQANNPLPLPIEDIEGAFTSLRNMLSGSSVIAGVNRIAVISELTQSAENADESLKVFAKETCIDVAPGASDLIFKINRPREASLDPIVSLNRLVTWSTQVSQLIQFQVSPMFMATAGAPMVQTHFAALEIDVNNVPLLNGATLSNVMGLVDECVAEVLALKENGHARLFGH